MAESESTSVESIYFCVGETFRSYKGLEEKVKLYEQRSYCKLWKRDSRTVEAARKRMSSHLADDIRYYEVTYGCIHGGRKFTG